MTHGQRVYLMWLAVKSKLLSPGSKPSLVAWFFLFSALFLLNGCAAPFFVALGSSSTAAASSVGTAATAAAIANPSTAASLASSMTTGKSPLEHAASAATKKDCNFFHVIGPKPICEDIPIPTIRDHSTPYPGPADAIEQNTVQSADQRSSK